MARMPIRLAEYGSEINFQPGSTKSEIIELLYSNPEYCYAPGGVADALGISEATAEDTLKQLYEDGQVTTTLGRYIALTQRKDLVHYASNRKD